jgi:hypothetical protein
MPPVPLERVNRIRRLGNAPGSNFKIGYTGRFMVVGHRIVYERCWIKIPTNSSPSSTA